MFFPVSIAAITLLEGIEEMVDVILVGIFYSEVIDNEGKIDQAPVMHPETGGELALAIASEFQAFLHEFLRNDSGPG
jgi:hypothetical protein